MKEFFKDHPWHMLLIPLIALSIILGSYNYKDSNGCNQVVFLRSGAQVDAVYIQSYTSGISAIKQCNGEVMETPTDNIKRVKYK